MAGAKKYVGWRPEAESVMVWNVKAKLAPSHGAQVKRGGN